MTPAQFVAQNEKEWWLQKLTLTEVRKIIIAHTGTKITTKECKAFLEFHCVVYRVLKRKPRSRHKVLSGEQWDKLREAVQSVKDDIIGGGIARALAFVSSKVSTNQNQLEGLPSRFHYWDMV